MIKYDEYAKWLEAVEKFPNLRMSEADMREIADLIESLRKVARAAKALHQRGQILPVPSSLTTSDTGTPYYDFLAALDACPQWVLEDNDG